MHLADSEVKLSLIHPWGEILGRGTQNISEGQPCEKGLKKAKFLRKRCNQFKKKKIQTKNKIYKNTTWETRCYNLAHPGPGNCVTIANRCHRDLKEKYIGGIGQPHLANWRKKYWLGFHRQEYERKISWLGFHHQENLPLPTKGHRRSSGNLTDLQKFWPPHQKKKSSNNNKYCVLCQRTLGTMHFWVEPFKSLHPKNYMCKDFSTEFCVQVKILLSHPRPHKKDIQ